MRVHRRGHPDRAGTILRLSRGGRFAIVKWDTGALSHVPTSALASVGAPMVCDGCGA